MDHLDQPNDLISNSTQWHVEKTYQVVWDSLFDYGRLECQHILQDLEKTLDIVDNDVLRLFDKVWCSKASLLLVAI